MSLIDDLRDVAKNFVASEKPLIEELPGLFTALLHNLEGVVHVPQPAAPVPPGETPPPGVDPIAAKLAELQAQVAALTGGTTTPEPTPFTVPPAVQPPTVGSAPGEATQVS